MPRVLHFNSSAPTSHLSPLWLPIRQVPHIFLSFLSQTISLDGRVWKCRDRAIGSASLRETWSGGTKRKVTGTQATVAPPVSGDAVVIILISSHVLRFRELAGHDAPKTPE